MDQRKQLSEAGVGQSKGQSCAGALDQLNGASFAHAGRRGRQFDESRRGHTSSALHTTAQKSALEVIVTEVQGRRRGTEPMNTRQVGCGLPEFFGNALAGGTRSSPGFQSSGQ